MPSTCAPLRAIGSVKLPRPQKKSAMRSPGCGSSRRIARLTITRFIALFTWVNSLGANGIVMPNSGRLYESGGASSGWNGTTVSGPPDCSQN